MRLLVTRLALHGSRVWALLLAALTLVSIVVASTMASSRLASSLDENWRGSYDVLVAPRGQDFGAGSTDGLVDPNFVGTAGRGGITLPELDAVRSIAGVEAAAPLGMVGSLRNTSLFPTLRVGDDAAAGTSALEGDTVASLTVEVLDARGSEERPLMRNQGIVALQHRLSPDIPLEQAVASSSVTGFSTVWSNRDYFVGLGSMPEFPASIIAVDPEAEAELLGEDNAGFLQPLLGLPANRSAGSSGWSARVDEAAYPAIRMELEQSGGGAAREVVPLVVRTYVPGSFVLRVTADYSTRVGPRFPTTVEELESAISDSGIVDRWVLESDVSSALTPFGGKGLIVEWPGTPSMQDNIAMVLPATQLRPELVGRPSYHSETGVEGLQYEGLQYRVKPQGVTDAAGQVPDRGELQLSGGQEHVGNVQSFRNPEFVLGGGFFNAVPAPVGTFTPDDVVDPQAEAASYVPSGVYSGNVTKTASGDEVWPNVSDQDFITGVPGAFTDLKGSQTLRGETPIDVIRVRVAGLDRYDAQAVDRVESVAEAIRALGLDAIVVAGSSPQAVGVYVPEYFVDADGTTSDLGWVRQEWTTLQVVADVERGISGATTALIVASTGAVMLAVTVTTLLAAAGHRNHVEVLRRMGWRDSRIRWLLAWVNAPMVAIVSSLALWATGGAVGLERGVVAAVPLVALAVFGAAIVIPFTVPRSRHPGRGLSTLSSVGGLVWRRLRVSPGAMALGVAGVLLAGGISFFGVVAVRQALEDAGATRLADLARSAVVWGHAGLALAGVCSAVLLVTISAAIQRTQRRHHDAVIRTVGYRPGTMRTIQRLEDSVRVTATWVLAAGAAIAARYAGAPIDALWTAVAMVAAVSLLHLALGQISLRGTT